MIHRLYIDILLYKISDTEGVRQSLVRGSKRVQEVRASAKQDTTVTAGVNLGNDTTCAFANGLSGLLLLSISYDETYYFFIRSLQLKYFDLSV